MKAKALFALAPITLALAGAMVAPNVSAVLLSQCNDLGASPTTGPDAVDVQCIDVTASDGHIKTGEVGICTSLVSGK